MTRHLSVFARGDQVVAVAVTYPAVFELYEEFAGGRGLDLDIVSDLEDAIRAGILDPTCSLRLGN
jgi:hypothetical protein